MRKYYNVIDNVSSVFFSLGFVASKLRHVPILLVGAASDFASLILYLLGYLFWLTASFFNPHREKKHDKWYGFAQFRKQHSISALIGAAAILLSLATVIAQLLIIPGCWLFLVSNILWSIAEYHKLQNPPSDDEEYTHARQYSYLLYTLGSTVSSCIIALSTTLTFIFPPLVLFTLPFVSVMSLGLSLFSLYHWCDYKFSKPELAQSKTSYHIMAEHMDLQQDSEIQPRPGYEEHHQPLFSPQRGSQNEDSLNDEQSPNLSI